MRPTDRVEFVRVLNGLAAIKPGGSLTAEAIDLWWNAMRAAWSIEDFKAAAAHLVGTVEFMPSPFHFEQLKRAGQLTPGEAWQLVVEGRPLEPGSRVARAAAIIGGQRAARMANIERDLPHLARRFREAFEDLTDVDQVRMALPQIVAPANSVHDENKKLPAPVMVGALVPEGHR